MPTIMLIYLSSQLMPILMLIYLSSQLMPMLMGTAADLSFSYHVDHKCPSFLFRMDHASVLFVLVHINACYINVQVCAREGVIGTREHTVNLWGLSMNLKGY